MLFSKVFIEYCLELGLLASYRSHFGLSPSLGVGGSRIINHCSKSSTPCRLHNGKTLKLCLRGARLLMTAPVRLRTKKLKKFKKAQLRRRGSRMIMTAPLRLPFKVYSVVAASAVNEKMNETKY